MATRQTAHSSVVRFESALPPESYAIVKKAAELYGSSMSNFVASAVLEKAQKAIAAHEKAQRTISLSRKDWEKLEFLLARPELFTEGIQRAMADSKNVEIDYSPSDIWDSVKETN